MAIDEPGLVTTLFPEYVKECLLFVIPSASFGLITDTNMIYVPSNIILQVYTICFRWKFLTTYPGEEDTQKAEAAMRTP